MSWAAAVRVAAGIGVGLGLAALPFLHYGLEGRHAATHVAAIARHAAMPAADARH